MKISSFILCGAILLLLFPLNVGSVTINYNGSGVLINKTGTWDNSPDDEFEEVISSLFPGDDILTQVNGILDETEIWYGNGASTIILEEIAGYENNTTFGWYDSNTAEWGQIFEGSDDSNTGWEDTNFSKRHFGFYIDPNGNSNDRMYTEHLLNNDDEYQVAIFQINDSKNDYLLAWEDLSLTGSTDRDYQDMIVRLKVNPVPEPATMLLLGSGLIAVAGFGRKKFYKKKK